MTWSDLQEPAIEHHNILLCRGLQVVTCIEKEVHIQFKLNKKNCKKKVKNLENFVKIDGGGFTVKFV